MGGSRTTTTQSGNQSQQYNSANTYGYIPTPDTEDITTARGFEFGTNPNTPYTFARANQRINDSYNRPLAANTTPAIRDAAARANTEDLAQEQAQAEREDNYNLQSLKYGQKIALADMTRPRLVQQGTSGTASGTSSGNSTTHESGNILDPIVSGASSFGSAVLL